MYEIFPVMAGVLLALVVPRFAAGRTRNAILGGVGAVVAVIVTIAAGEEWFFVFVDFAEVLLAIGLTLAVKDRLPLGKPTRGTVDVR